MGCKKGLQLDVGKFASLGQLMHAASYFDIDMSLVYQWTKVVVVNDLRGKDVHRDVHASVVLSQHGGAQVKIFEVTHHALCLWCGHNTVE